MGDQIKKIAVLGLGVSGASVVGFAQRQGLPVIAWDDRAETRAGFDGVLIGVLDDQALLACDYLVAAAGIADDHPVIEAAMRLGVPVICDVELWSLYYPRMRVIAITGTNGKSTVTAMVHHALPALGYDAVMGGNIGVPVFDMAIPEDGNGLAVLELSSFQIERCQHFHADIAALLNISPDHLDRHGEIRTYANIKAQLFKGSGHAVIGQGDQYCIAIADRLSEGGERSVTRIADYARVDDINLAFVSKILEMLHGKTVDLDVALSGFAGLPHRRQEVGMLQDVLWIDDSKATNPEATVSALKGRDDASVILIAGGKLKSEDFSALEEALPAIAHVCVIGADVQVFYEWLRGQGIAYSPCVTMEQATAEAFKRAQDIETASVVLLSPAAASYDQYNNFAQRGDDFIRCFRKLAAGVEA